MNYITLVRAKLKGADQKAAQKAHAHCKDHASQQQ